MNVVPLFVNQKKQTVLSYHVKESFKGFVAQEFNLDRSQTLIVPLLKLYPAKFPKNPSAILLADKQRYVDEDMTVSRKITANHWEGTSKPKRKGKERKDNNKGNKTSK